MKVIKKDYVRQAQLKHVGILGMHWGHHKASTKNTGMKKRTVSLKTKLKRFDDKIGNAFGMKKRSDGKWIVTPESYAKATGLGIALGFTSFALELGARKYIASHSAQSLAQSAEYVAWLAKG